MVDLYDTQGAGDSVPTADRLTVYDRQPASKLPARPRARRGETSAEYNERLDAWIAQQREAQKRGLEMIGKPTK